MMTEAVVDRAQAKICRALRREIIGSRAALPFDPQDPLDVRTWIRQQLAASHSQRYLGTVAYASQALLLDALTAARKARRHTHREDGKVVAMAGLDALAAIASQPIWWDGWPEALEWVADLMAGTARFLVVQAPHAQVRKALATLSCLGRTVAAIKSSFAPGISDAFNRHLVTSRDYCDLPLQAHHRSSFEAALKILRPGDNLRQVLAAARIPWAGAKQWREFRTATQIVAATRYGGEYRFGNEEHA